MLALWLCLLAVQWRYVWAGVGLVLRADGVHDRTPLGSLFVPWEALAADDPAVPADRDGLTLHLYFRRPELVRRRGLRGAGRDLVRTGADPWFLAFAMHEYASRPELRAAIGTEAELARLGETFPAPSPAADVTG